MASQHTRSRVAACLNGITGHQIGLRGQHHQRYSTHRQAKPPSAVVLSSQTIRLNKTLHDLLPNITYLVGAAIFHESPSLTHSYSRRLLVIKRADGSKAFPGMWCVPGGHVEPGETIEQAIKRETYEETGLTVEMVVEEFEELRWISHNGKRSSQLNFVARIGPFTRITLNPREHSTWMWATEEETSKLPCSDGMAKVFRDAFRCSQRENVEGESCGQ